MVDAPIIAPILEGPFHMMQPQRKTLAVVLHLLVDLPDDLIGVLDEGGVSHIDFLLAAHAVRLRY